MTRAKSRRTDPSSPTPARNVVAGAARSACGAPPSGDGSHITLSKVKKSKNGKIRAAVLIGVHVVLAIHLAHWMSSESTISPLEPSEAMYSLERGAVNAGAVLFVLAILSTLIFGRFFCGWGCHVVALQDACSVMMKKIGIRPRMFRTRTLVWVPFLVGFYMFLWPTVYREMIAPFLDPNGAIFTWLGTPAPVHFEWELTKTRETFWETFPGWGISLFTFFVCGFVVVYFLGSKGFCNYGCPYGAFFAVADRFSPGKIVANLDACESCGHCTAACTSNVSIHKEIQVYEKVVDTNCMKCLDCVSVCPNGALSFGFTKPQVGTQTLPGKKKPKRNYDTTPVEEIVLWVVGFSSFYFFRGAYGLVPLLLSIGLAGVVVFSTWRSIRLFKDRNGSFNKISLKRGGKWQPAGVLFVVATGVLLSVNAHTGWMKLEGAAASRSATQIQVSPQQSLAPDFEPNAQQRLHAEEALKHYERLMPIWHGGWGLLENPAIDTEVAGILAILNRHEEAETVLARSLETAPSDLGFAYLGELRALNKDPAGALRTWTQRLESDPDSFECAQRLVRVLVETGETSKASEALGQALAASPNESKLHALAAAIHMVNRDPKAAEASLARAIEIDSDNLIYRQRWVELLLTQARFKEAYPSLLSLTRTVRHDPALAQMLAEVCRRLNRTEDARHWAQEAQRRQSALQTRGTP